MKIPLTPPAHEELLKRITADKAGTEKFSRIMFRGVGPSPAGEYLHWDKMRHLVPPQGLEVEDWWLATKWARIALRRPLPFADKYGRAFSYTMPDVVLDLLHRLDRAVSGRIPGTEQITNPGTRDTYLVSSLIEEAITSSQLEGASTTRKVAKDMLREGRAPRTVSERMIVNNYHAMQFVREHANIEMTRNTIFELHRILVNDTLDDPAMAGRFRRDEDDIHVVDSRDSVVLHTPPASAELGARLKGFCQFANDAETDKFVHPAIRAIILHFMLAYDHPFTDGNGRTARVLFYWSMLKQGYWLTEYLSISRILKAAPAEYSRAYLHTETDDGDVTYFIVHQLKVLLRSIDELHRYLAKKVGEIHDIEGVIRKSPPLRERLNHRQIALLGHALRNPNAQYRIAGHRQSHNVTYDTARTDLLALADVGLLTKSHSGRAFVFVSPADIAERLRKPGKRMPASNA